MYQNPYYPYSSPYPYAYYPSHSPYRSRNKRSKEMEQPTVEQELKEAQSVSYPVLSQIENKVEEVEAAEKEESTSEEVEEVDTFTKRFLNYLGKRKGTTVSVTTSAEVIKGTLAEVSSDCILVKADEESYHIRPEGIIYFK